MQAGKSSRKQQYQCKNCKKKFITELNYSEEFKRQEIAMFYEGNSGRAAGKIDENKVSKEIIEMDELYIYTADKKTELI